MESLGDVGAILRRFEGLRIVVLGDVILDRYWWGEASRLSPEAPVPVVRKQRSTLRPGGAANTAANLAALGAKVTLIGLTGADREAEELRLAAEESGVKEIVLLRDNTRPTTTKTRIIAAHQQIVRVDDEESEEASVEITAQAEDFLSHTLVGAQALVVSDYSKGFLTPELLRAACAWSDKLPVFVDPKGEDSERYGGCTLLKPNRLELGILTNRSIRDHSETVAAGAKLSGMLPGTRVLVTEGADGMTLFHGGSEFENVRSAPRQVFDVTGAGDTVLATLAMAHCSGATWKQAMLLASEAASLVIGRMGTTAVTKAELARSAGHGEA